jgi:3-phenylpropionate/trans-cinnamate dioxygenase ferredoxin component
MEFVKAARIADVPSGSTLRVEHGGDAVLVANLDGSFYAISDTCTHQGGTLSQGTIEDGIVTCPRHGSRFDVRTGKNMRGPKILLVRGKTDDVKSYPVKVEGDDILVGFE